MEDGMGLLRDMLQVERRMRHDVLIGQILPEGRFEYWIGFDQVAEAVVRVLLNTGVAVEATSATDRLRGTRRFRLAAR